ncbi:UNVERIFIED_CONTAM: hypothetical protein HDU68_007462 [Siphonaria sp. JEL0065]|nr:hypothetical protein HDU68_007462 [Siphonaria sp. JEL0065]
MSAHHSCLYTSMIYRNRKVKPFQDGFVRFNDGKVQLFDSAQKSLASLFVSQIDDGDELEFDRFYCVVADVLVEDKVVKQQQVTLPPPFKPRFPTSRIANLKFKPLSIPGMSVTDDGSLQQKPQQQQQQQQQQLQLLQNQQKPRIQKQLQKKKYVNNDSHSDFDEEDDGLVFDRAAVARFGQLGRVLDAAQEEQEESPFAIISPAIEDSFLDHNQSKPVVSRPFDKIVEKPLRPATNFAYFNDSDDKNVIDIDEGPYTEDLHSLATLKTSFTKQQPLQQPLQKPLQKVLRPPIKPLIPSKALLTAKVPKFGSFKPPTKVVWTSSQTINNLDTRKRNASSIAEHEYPRKNSSIQNSGSNHRNSPTTGTKPSRYPPQPHQSASASKIPLHSISNLYFKTRDQCVGLKKSNLKRTFQIPTRFSSPQEYKTTFQTAITEHLQIQLDAVALRLHAQSLNQSTGNSTSFYSKVTIYPASVSTLSRESFQHKEGQPTFSERSGNLLLALDTKPQHVEVSKDDIWIISPTQDFSRGVFIAVGVFYGVSGLNTVEIKPFRDNDLVISSTLDLRNRVYAIHAINAMTELLTFNNLDTVCPEEEDGVVKPIVVMDDLLGVDEEVGGPRRVLLEEPPEDEFDKVAQMVEDVKSEFALNEDQGRVIEEVASAVWEGRTGFQLVHGVFGSGKTYLIAVLVIFFHRAIEDGYFQHIPNFRIGISSMSNVAVDQILHSLLKQNFHDFVRIGSIKKISKTLLPYTLQQLKNSNDDLKELKQMLKQSDSLDFHQKRALQEAVRRFTANENRNLLDTAFVVGVTCVASGFEALEGVKTTFLILDECSQMTEPLSLLPILRFNPSTCLLIGDPQQLSPTLETNTSNPSTSLDCTLYSRLLQHKKHKSIMLRTQYRCHPKIAQIPNRLFYGGELVHGSKEFDTGAVVDGLGPAVFVDVSGGGERRGYGGSGGSLVNHEEVEAVERLVKAFVNLGVENNVGGKVEGDEDCEGVVRGVDATKIGVITYYKSQSAALQQKLSADASLVGVQVSTVDSFQGGEKDVIFISTVRSTEVGFIDDAKRVNVSLTRARRHLVIVGNGRLLSKSRVWREVLNGCDVTTTSEVLKRFRTCVVEEQEDVVWDQVFDDGDFDDFVIPDPQPTRIPPGKRVNVEPVCVEMDEDGWDAMLAEDDLSPFVNPMVQPLLPVVEDQAGDAVQDDGWDLFKNEVDGLTFD